MIYQIYLLKIYDHIKVISISLLPFKRYFISINICYPYYEYTHSSLTCGVSTPLLPPLSFVSHDEFEVHHDVPPMKPPIMTPLQTYQHQQQPVSNITPSSTTICENIAKVMPYTSPFPSSLLNLSLPPDIDGRIAPQKDICSTCNALTHYVSLSYHRLSSLHYHTLPSS